MYYKTRHLYSNGFERSAKDILSPNLREKRDCMKSLQPSLGTNEALIQTRVGEPEEKEKE